MKPTGWIQFSWNLNALPAMQSSLQEHYQIVAATREDEKELRRVIASSFTLDADWNAAIQEVTQTVDAWLDRAGEIEDTVYLALRHGTRMIGAAVVSLDPAAENHLSPGPCVLVEYRNRGFGTALLQRSLETLRAAGFTNARALSKENSPVARFVYSKFNSTRATFDFTPALAA